MVKMTLKKELDEIELKERGAVLGFKELKLLFNAGPFPGGGHCIFVEADGKVDFLNSNDLINDLEVYDLSEE